MKRPEPNDIKWGSTRLSYALLRLSSRLDLVGQEYRGPLHLLGPGGVWNRSPALDRVEIPAFFAGALFGNGLVSRGSGLAVLYPCTLAGSGLAIGRRHSLYGRRLVLPG